MRDLASRETDPNGAPEQILTKVPEITLIFWVVKVAATTLGETAGDAVSMSMNLGYLIGTAIFGVLFAVVVVVQIRAKKFHPFLYWTTIVATTTVGTTLADFADRSLLGIGYVGGTSLLLACLLASLFIWHRTLGSISVRTIISPAAEVFYWVTIMFSQTLGTALGDWTVDTAGLGFGGGALLFAVAASAAPGLCSVLLDIHFSRVVILGRIHSHAAPGCGCGRSTGQAP